MAAPVQEVWNYCNVLRDDAMILGHCGKSADT